MWFVKGSFLCFSHSQTLAVFILRVLEGERNEHFDYKTARESKCLYSFNYFLKTATALYLVSLVFSLSCNVTPIN